MPWHKEVTLNTHSCSRQLSNRKNTNSCDRQLATRHSDIVPHVRSEHDYFEWVHCTSTSSESGAYQFPEGLYFMNALWQSETKNTVHHQILKIITSVHCACICRIQTKLTLGSHEHQFTGNWLSRAIVHCYRYLPNALKSATISPRESWKGMSARLSACVTVESGPIESPENRIFKAVPMPWICVKTATHGNIVRWGNVAMTQTS